MICIYFRGQSHLEINTILFLKELPPSFMQRAESKQGGVCALRWNYHLSLVPHQKRFNRAVFAKKRLRSAQGVFLFDCSHVHLWREGLCLDLGLSAVRLHPDGSQRQGPKGTD